MPKEISWKKDVAGDWHFHWGLESRRRIVQSWFNWRPAAPSLGIQVSLSRAGFNLELAIWFHWNFVILFFDPTSSRSTYDEEYDTL